MDAFVPPPTTSHVWGPTTNYLHVPHQLLANLQDTPVAVGVWCLIARVSLLTKAPVPLSAADLQAYDPTLSRGAVVRALARLEANHFISTERGVGQKHRYTPRWGSTRAGVHPWQWNTSHLGRPRQLRCIRIDRTLFDTFIGQIQVHPQHAATIRRRVTVPLLGLRDVGAYALSALGYHEGTPTLAQWGLVTHGQPQTVPSEAAVLAQLSQQMLSDATDRLTDLGWRQLGVVQARADTSDGDPLFFVPPSMIGSLIGPLIGEVIGQAQPCEMPQIASGSATSTKIEQTDSVTGSQGSQGSHSITTTPGSGGGMRLVSKENPVNPTRRKSPARSHTHSTALATPLPTEQHTVAHARHTSSTQAPTTPIVIDNAVAQRLQTLRVNPKSIASLSDLPLATVEATIRAAEERPDVRDQAGWVVAALRAQRDQPWHLARATHDVTDWNAVRAWAQAEGLLDRHADALTAVSDVHPDALPPTPAPPLGQAGEQVAEAADDVTPAVLAWAPTAHAWPSLAIDDMPAPSDPRGGTTAARSVVTAHPAPRPTTSPVDTRPAWMTEAQWNALPLAVQGVFRGSRLVDGTIQARSVQTQRLITERYAGWARELQGAIDATVSCSSTRFT